MKKAVLAVVVLFCLAASRAAAIDAESFGLSAGGDPLENARALQKAVDCGGEIRVSKAGIYDIGATCLSATTLRSSSPRGWSFAKTPSTGCSTTSF